MKKYFIFDMDGVLIDSEPVHQQILSQTFQELGISLLDEYYYTLVGMAAGPMWEKIKADFALHEEVGSLVKKHKVLKGQLLLSYTIPATPGILSLLNRLKLEGYVMAVASSSPKLLIESYTSQLHIQSFFQEFVSGEEVSRSKPFPDIFLKTADLLGVLPSVCIVIEDSRNGVVAAKSAGMFCIGYKNEHSGPQDLSMADVIIEHFDEITSEFLSNLPVCHQL